VSRSLAGGGRRGAALALWRSWLGCVALFGLPTQVTVGAATLAEPHASEIRKVIESQLEAFAADDPERAYSHASQGIRDRFGDATTFMAMVRRGYPMLIRPAAVAFLRAQAFPASEPSPDTVQQAVQIVQVRDREGRLWQATYVLERQAGAGWRIGGCVVAADRGMSGRQT
jgi:hypothetical protein